MKSDTYNAPVIEELAQAQTPEVEPVQTPVAIKAIAQDVDKTSNESFWRGEVDKYFRYLSGERGYKNDAERIKDNIAFMQRAGTMLSYSYPEFEDCMLYLIQKMRNEPAATADGRFFRYLENCELSYSHAALGQYRMLMSFCIKIARCWPTRVKLARATDIQSMIAGMRAEAKDNLEMFVRKMANYAIQ